MTALIVSAEARTDTFEILEELKNKAGASVSARYAVSFRDAVARLPEMPRSGSPQSVIILAETAGRKSRGEVKCNQGMIAYQVTKSNNHVGIPKSKDQRPSIEAKNANGPNRPIKNIPKLPN